MSQLQRGKTWHSQRNTRLILIKENHGSQRVKLCETPVKSGDSQLPIWRHSLAYTWYTYSAPLCCHCRNTVLFFYRGFVGKISKWSNSRDFLWCVLHRRFMAMLINKMQKNVFSFMHFSHPPHDKHEVRTSFNPSVCRLVHRIRIRDIFTINHNFFLLHIVIKT